MDRVSLRDIAAAANVHPALIGRYIGRRDELVLAVFDDLSSQLAAAVLEMPLVGQGFGPDTVMGKWSRVAGALVIGGRPIAGRDRFNPVMAMAETLVGGVRAGPRGGSAACGADRRRRAGWRIFEDYLVEAGELEPSPLDVLRDELARSARRLGATPWPSPPDPSPQRR